MSFENDTGKEAPEYEAFEAALQMAVQDTRAAMLRLAKAVEADDDSHRGQSDDKAAPVAGGQ
jgi:hypothetical protein